jgi:hypothetical protein
VIIVEYSTWGYLSKCMSCGMTVNGKDHTKLVHFSTCPSAPEQVLEAEYYSKRAEAEKQCDLAWEKLNR